MNKNKVIIFADIIITLALVIFIKNIFIAFPLALALNYGLMYVLNNKTTKKENYGAAITIANVVFICVILMFIFTAIFKYVLSMATV
jgi:hypothetical protein